MCYLTKSGPGLWWNEGLPWASPVPPPVLPSPSPNPLQPSHPGSCWSFIMASTHYNLALRWAIAKTWESGSYLSQACQQGSTASTGCVYIQTGRKLHSPTTLTLLTRARRYLCTFTRQQKNRSEMHNTGEKLHLPNNGGRKREMGIRGEDACVWRTLWEWATSRDWLALLSWLSVRFVKLFLENYIFYFYSISSLHYHFLPRCFYSFTMWYPHSFHTRVSLACPPRKQTRHALVPQTAGQAGHMESSGVHSYFPTCLHSLKQKVFACFLQWMVAFLQASLVEGCINHKKLILDLHFSVICNNSKYTVSKYDDDYGLRKLSTKEKRKFIQMGKTGCDCWLTLSVHSNRIWIAYNTHVNQSNLASAQSISEILKPQVVAKQ